MRNEAQNSQNSQEEKKTEDTTQGSTPGQEPKRQYSAKVIQLAREMKELFPEADAETLLNLISQNPNLALESLVEIYLTR